MDNLIYFTGLDLNHCVVNNGDASTDNIGTSSKFVKILNAMTNIHMRFDVIVFQKVGSNNNTDKSSSWFIKGQKGLFVGSDDKDEKEVFSDKLEISQICLTANTLVGFSNMTNTLYKVDFAINYDDSSKLLSCWNVKSIKHPDSSMKIKQIATNDKSVYVLDDHSGIFEMSDDVLGDKTLILKWRLDNVEILKFCCGFGHFVVLSDTGALFSWGSGGRGELGHFVNDHVMVNCEPKRIEFFDDLPSTIDDLVCGGWHTLALTSDGDIYSWGWNESGQLGYNSNSNVVIGGVPYPIDLGSGTDPVVQIACGARHSLAVLKSGKCFSWGLNKHGELGLSDFDNRSEPVEIKFNATDDDYDKKYNNIAKVDCGRWCSFVYFS